MDIIDYHCLSIDLDFVMATDLETLFPSKSSRTPEVIVFQEHVKTKSVNTPIKRKQSRSKKGRDTESNDAESSDFVDVAREVKEFGATGFTRKENKKYEQARAERLGAKKQKQQKVPYPMLMQRIKRKKEWEEKDRQLEQAMGVFKKKKKKEEVPFQRRMNLGRWVDKSTLGGKWSQTKVKINRKDLSKLKISTSS